MKEACKTAEISYHSFLRWKSGKTTDNRKGSDKSIPRRLSPEEEEAFYNTANSKEYRDKTPAQIVANLLEQGIYYGSVSTLYRILRKKSALQHRGESKARSNSRKPQELIATGPNQVWTWDITWLKTSVLGMFLFAYVIIDIYSRKIVGWSVEHIEDTVLARDLFERTIRNHTSPKFVHSDNGGPMKGLNLVTFLTKMKVGLSFSRPRVSDDNPFIESFFGSMKSNVKYPKQFENIEEARTWFANFVHWYNNYHSHSGIGYVTPNQKHTGEDVEIFEKRQATLNKAAVSHPERFVKGPRIIMPERDVILNKAA